MAERRWAGSWLSGPAVAGNPDEYPGQRLGLPEEGPRSVAGMGRRIVALFIDWLISMVIALGFFHSARTWTLVIFAVQVYLLTALAGLTIGKRILGMRVVRLDSRPIGFGWALVRTLLLLAVVPPLFTDRDHRGLHDRAAHTVVIRV